MTTITKMTKTDDGDGDGDDDDDSLFLSIHVNGDKIDINRKAVIIPKPKKKMEEKKKWLKIFTSSLLVVRASTVASTSKKVTMITYAHNFPLSSLCF